jgi:hypothetical protein
MNHILTIGGRQFRSYFNGPVAYIVICIVMLTLGFFFWNTFSSMAAPALARCFAGSASSSCLPFRR